MKFKKWMINGRWVVELFTDNWKPIRNDEGACFILDSQYVDIDREIARVTR